MTVISRAQSHVTIDDRGIARVDGTRQKVIDIAKSLKSQTPSIPQLIDSFPHLKPAQIHAALAYYYDHQAAFDIDIERESAEFAVARAGAAPTAGSLKVGRTDMRP